MEIQDSIPLAPFTTFEIGGPAHYLARVSTTQELQQAVTFAHESSLPFVVIGGGSNLLVKDDGFAGVVIKVVCDNYAITDTTVSADAGKDLTELIRRSATAGLTGWENLAGIPGTIGGAVRGNAGAFGTEIKDVLFCVEAYNTRTFATRIFANAECAFSYRNSFFKKNPEWVVMRVIVHLTKDIEGMAPQLIEDTIAERNRRHLQNVRAAGSYFMNPEAPETVIAQFEQEKGVQAREGRVPAGWLIEKAGYKGFQLGGAESSRQHPNYLVNREGATSDDVVALASLIKTAVKKHFGIELHEEVTIL